MNDDYVLGENKILPISNDKVFHDMFSWHDMKTIEWIVMMILDKTYKEIHGHVHVYKKKLFNISKEDKRKFIDLIVSLDSTIIVIEINNHFHRNCFKNVFYIMNSINNSFIVKKKDYTKKVQGIIVNLNWDDNKNEKKQEISYKYPISECKHNDFLLKIVNINLYYKNNTDFIGLDNLSTFLAISNRKELKEFIKKEKLLINYYNKMDRLLRNKEYCYWCGLIELTKT